MRAFLVLALLLGGCRIPQIHDVKPGTKKRCDEGVCWEVVWFESHEEVVGGWIQAPHGVRLLNAHLLSDGSTPCQPRKMPLAWVTIDNNPAGRGPLDLEGEHGVVLGFPFNAWFDHSGYWREMYVDLELEVAGRTRCWRTQLTKANGKVAL